MNANLISSELSAFNGVRFDTCANTSVICEAQYMSYCSEFGLRPSIRPPGGRCITGIGGMRKLIGIVNLQIPFTQLDLVINVDFMMLKENVPTLISVPDIILNGLDISVQRRHVSLGKRTQQLSMEKYFLVHRWTKDCAIYSCYTQDELCKIHRTFGHPSALAMVNLLNRADVDGKLADLTRRVI